VNNIHRKTWCIDWEPPTAAWS